MQDKEFRRFTPLKDTEALERLIKEKGLSREDLTLLLESIKLDAKETKIKITPFRKYTTRDKEKMEADMANYFLEIIKENRYPVSYARAVVSKLCYLLEKDSWEVEAISMYEPYQP